MGLVCCVPQDPSPSASLVYVRCYVNFSGKLLKQNCNKHLLFKSQITTSVNFMAGKFCDQNYNASFFPCVSYWIELLHCCLYMQTHTHTPTHAHTHTYLYIQRRFTVMMQLEVIRICGRMFKIWARRLPKINFGYATLVIKRWRDAKPH